MSAKKHKVEKTNVMRVLDQHHVAYASRYYGNTNALAGMEVATVLGLNPAQVFKTLVTQAASGDHYVFLVPVAHELSLKKAARAMGEKSLTMIHQKDLLPLTGYVHGGCSPIGMKKPFPTCIDRSAQDVPSIMFSAGKIGYQVEVTLVDLSKVLEFSLADLVS